MKQKGLFISIEGIDGSGKTTQINLLSDYLINNHHDIVVTKEPGGTKIAEKIRDVVLNPDTETNDEKMHPETEALLFAAGRAQHVRHLIKPALEAGKIVLCDRFVDSSLVYQGVVRNLGIEKVMAINSLAIDNCLPDLTICFTLPIDVVMERLLSRDRKLDRIEKDIDEDFYKKLIASYEELAKLYPKRVYLLDANDDIKIVFEKIKQLISHLYPELVRLVEPEIIECKGISRQLHP